MSDKLTEDELAYFASGGGEAQPEEKTAPKEKLEQTAEPPSQPEIERTAEPEGEAEAEAPNEHPEGQKKDDADRGPVPYAALKQERERRKQSEQQLRDLQTQWARADERLNMMERARQEAMQRQQPQPEAPRIPTVDDGQPLEAIAWLQQREMDRMQREEAQQRQTAEQTQVQQYRNNVWNTWSRVAQDRAQADPEFTPAYQFLNDQRVAELQAAGLNQDQAQHQAREDTLQFVHEAFQQRINPADRMLAVARARGFTAPQPAPQGGADERLSTVARGQEANQTLSRAGTSANARSNKTDLKAVSEMSDKEFETWFSKVGPEGFNQVMGGN